MRTYLLTMDPVRRDRTIRELDKAGIRPPQIVVVHGVNGRETVRSEDLGHACRYFCTDKTVGCGISHIRIADMVARSKAPYALVVEDDIRAIPGVTCMAAMDEARRRVSQTQPDWHIIKLHWTGFPRLHMSGSTGAYLLSDKGARILREQQLHWHIDLQFPYALNVVDGPLLWQTFDPQTPPIIGNMSWRFYASQHLFGFGGLVVTVMQFLCVLAIVVILLVVATTANYRRNSQSARSVSNTPTTKPLAM